MAEIEGLKAQETVARRVVTKLVNDGLAPKGAYFTPDQTGHWSLHILPDPSQRKDWQALRSRISDVVHDIAKEVPEAGWPRFQLVREDDPVVRAISTLMATQTENRGIVSGYDGIKYIESALVLRHAA
jgi:hypothetical protein